MEIELALSLVNIRLNRNIQKYAFRLLKLSTNHPVKTVLVNIPNLLKSVELANLTPNPRANSSNGVWSYYETPPHPIRQKATKLRHITQLELVYTSIQELVNIANLEPIQHFYFAP